MARFPGHLVLAVWISAAASARAVDLGADPDFESKYLALDVSGELTPPQHLVAQFSSDLAAIRSQYPEMAEIHLYPRWQPGEVWLRFDRSCYDALASGDHSSFASLFAHLGLPEVSLDPEFFPGVLGGRFTFPEFYHPDRLIELFGAVAGVTEAFAPPMIGDGDDIDVLPGGVYLLSRGFGDCPAGCTDRHTWRFQVTDDDVIQLSAAPEPGTATLAAAALALLARSARRRNSSRRPSSIHHEALHRPRRPGRRP